MARTVPSNVMKETGKSSDLLSPAHLEIQGVVESQKPLLNSGLDSPHEYLPQIVTLFKGLRDVYSAFGVYRTPGEWTRIEKRYSDSVSEYLSRNTVRDFVAYYKEFCSQGLARVLRNTFEVDLELEPFNFWLDDGIKRYFIMRHRSAGLRKSTTSQKFRDMISFCYNLNQAKKTADSFKFITVDSLVKHRDLLQKKSVDIPDSLKKTIRETVQRYLPRSFGKTLELGGNPTKKSCYEASVQKGGKFSVILDEGQELLRGSSSVSLRKLAIENSFSLRRETDHKDRVIKSLWMDERRRLAKVVSISEPLKARTLTKASRDFLLLQNLQKKLHSCLRVHSTFELIGGQSVIKSVQDVADNRPIDFKFCSGDYSAATDTLYRSAIETCVDEIIDWGEIPLDVAQLFVEDMDTHILEYPKVLDKDMSNIEQTNGQLMGCITSFPVLCLLNDAIYEYIRYHHPGQFSHVRKVNGDDILFCCTSRGYDVWLKGIGDIGFVPSPGKNYHHVDFCMVNNRPFLVDSNNLVRPLEKWNFSLLSQRQLDEDEKPLTIEDRAKNLAIQIELLYESHDVIPYDKISFAIRVFKTRNSKCLKRSPRSLVIPEILGGFGVFDRIWDRCSFEERTELLNGLQDDELKNHSLFLYSRFSPPSIFKRQPVTVAELLHEFDHRQYDDVCAVRIHAYKPVHKEPVYTSGWSELKKIPHKKSIIRGTSYLQWCRIFRAVLERPLIEIHRCMNILKYSAK